MPSFWLVGGALVCTNFCHFGSVRVVQLEEGRSQLSLRQSHSPKHQLALVHACKPHSKAVTSLAINSEGSILASGVSAH